MASSDKRSSRLVATGGRPKLIGSLVRVVTRRGYVLEGTCLDAWQLRSGGVALKVKPSDGSPPREVTTLNPVVVLSDSGGDSG